MRKFIFIGFIVLGAALGLFAAMNESVGVQVVMAAVGTVAGVAIGGALFMSSDALLATNKFADPLPLASLWVLGTYWSAQWCIASWLAPRQSPARSATG